MARDLTALADVLGRNSTAALKFDDQAAAENILLALQEKPHVIGACLYAQDGRRFAKYVRQGTQPSFPARVAGDGHRFEPDRFILFRPIHLDKKAVGTVYLEADLGELNARVKSFVGIATMVLCAATAITIVLSFWLQRLISRPILNLADTARIVREQRNYSVRAPGHEHNEIGLLTDSFNEMLAQIQMQNNALCRAHDELERRVQERTAELSTANKELEAFCYSVSHDLRAPLRGLDGFSHALLEDYGDQLDEPGRDMLHRIHQASRRMDRLIDDLLDLSRVSRSALRREPVDLSGLARDVAGELGKRDPQRHVEVRIADDLQAEGDPRLLRVALENLLGNAWKYTAKRPQAMIEFGRNEANGNSSFFVRDDGVGFDMQYVDKLFAPFQRLHGTNEFPGTGIGLATVQRIIQRHGGRVWAQAEVNKGATFHFTLS